jgi:hypothetical protein
VIPSNFLKDYFFSFGINIIAYLFTKIQIMAKGSSSDSRKVSFGKRKRGSAKKAFNKHNPKPKAYRGQGR